MGTKRTPINREARRQLSPHAVELYRRVCSLWPTRSACIRGEACKPEKTVGVHCSECVEQIDGSLELDRMLGLWPWQDLRCDAQEPAGLSPAKREAFWTDALAQALAEALAK